MARVPDPLRVHLAQIDLALGDVQANVERHLEAVARARDENAHLVVFPELSVTGYLLQDLVADLALDPATSPALAPLREASRDIDLVIGLVEAGEDGRAYNSAVWLHAGDVLFAHRKVFLPTYTLFDEGRYFAPGNRVRAVSTPLGRAGILVCEDLWHPPLWYLLAEDGADFILAPSSSPARGVQEGDLGSQRAWKLLGEAAARFHTEYVIYVGRVGVEDGHTFGGGSFVYSPEGILLAELPLFEEAGVTVELERQALRRARSVSPMRRDDRPGLIHRELGRILAEKGDPK